MGETAPRRSAPRARFAAPDERAAGRRPDGARPCRAASPPIKIASEPQPGARATLKKNFILDTNVLLHDPRSIFGFGDNNVVIPIYVIEEIDNFKRDLSSLGRNARQVSRYLDEFRATGPLRDGVSLGPERGTIRVVITERKLPPELGDGHSTDNRILATALDLRDREKALPAVFVTKDTNRRIRA